MKPTPEEVFARIFKQVELDAINQEVDAMSDAEITKELEAEGYTKDKIDRVFEKQQKMLDEIIGGEKWARRKQVVTYAGGLATAAAVALVVSKTTNQTNPTVPINPTAATPPRAGVEELRREAFEACGRGHWGECARKLNDAKQLDPAGESAPDVQNARKLIAHH